MAPRMRARHVSRLRAFLSCLVKSAAVAGLVSSRPCFVSCECSFVVSAVVAAVALGLVSSS